MYASPAGMGEEPSDGAPMDACGAGEVVAEGGAGVDGAGEAGAGEAGATCATGAGAANPLTCSNPLVNSDSAGGNAGDVGGAGRSGAGPVEGAGAAAVRSGAAGRGAWGEGGISGSSTGVGGCAVFETEKTAWHLRHRTRAPCIGILSSAIV